MAPKPQSEHPTSALARRAALALPGVEQGIACEGTAVESRTFKVKGKAFLFLRPGVAMLKLREALPEAAKLAAKEPHRYAPGSGGWVKVMFDPGAPAGKTDGPSREVMERWIGESYQLYAGDKPGGAARNGAKAKKKVQKKKSTRH